jgi:hypothetical protein
MAGATTFIVMSYIIAAAVMTILMGLYSNKAYALAPGHGINAIVAFPLVGQQELSFPSAMGLIVLEGVVVTALVLTGLREQIMRAIPIELKKAIAIGIRPLHRVHRALQLGDRRPRLRRAGHARTLHDLADLRHVRRDHPHARTAGARLQGRPVRRQARRLSRQGRPDGRRRVIHVGDDVHRVRLGRCRGAAAPAGSRWSRRRSSSRSTSSHRSSAWCRRRRPQPR